MKVKQIWRVILTSDQLEDCVVSKSIVEIFFEEDLDYIGEIIGYSDYRIDVEGGSYLRANCKVRKEVSLTKSASLDLHMNN